ncbi:MAG: DNA-binding response regulator [Rhodospirillales bacterium 69-11]|nr:response regulator transcription factor [Rhodospirillales bacterium]MBN8905833.1 response regulator transcription factor [Rhodospirillales bacterium]MBN8925084.1 response regulator transcription factor [Rhodospirillales bacterium]OJW21059.1 MAG: DNA-binding response regulator [Rhodospirillales bacterium 69-11]
MQQHSLRHAPSSPDPVGAEQPIVVVVDDDLTVREGLSELILSVGLNVVAFASTQDLLASGAMDRPGCLILDVRMPGASGLDLQHRLAATGDAKPIIFLSGHGDIPMTVQAMKAGAVDFLTKPVRDQALLDAIATALDRDRSQRATAEVARHNADRLKLLTPREHQVLAEVARGRLNKQIAYDFGISEVTVKLHRSKAMRKMQLATVGALIRAWETLPAHVRLPPSR